MVNSFTDIYVSGGAAEYTHLVPDTNRCLKTGLCFPFHN